MISISELITQIDQHAKTVLLKRDSSDGVREQPVSVVWRADYAVLMLRSISDAKPDSLSAQLAEARSQLEALMIHAEEDNRGLIDGYLIAALPKPPSDDLLPEIQRQELDPLICRTHLVWPEHGNWQRLNRLAILPPVKTKGEATAPLLPTDLAEADLLLLARLESEAAAAIGRDIIQRVEGP